MEQHNIDGSHVIVVEIQLSGKDLFVYGGWMGWFGETYFVNAWNCSVVSFISFRISNRDSIALANRDRSVEYSRLSAFLLCSHLCRRQLSRFAHEQILYPPHLLPLHDPSKTPRGHRRPQPRGKYEEEMVEVWGMPHPMCEVSARSRSIQLGQGEGRAGLQDSRSLLR